MKKENKKRLAVYQKYNGKCGYCGNDIEYKDMQIDHIYPKHLKYNTYDWGGRVKQCPDNIDCFENLMPSCRMCNFYKGGLTIENFRKQMQSIHDRLQKEFIFRLSLKYGIINIMPFDGKFYFEK